MQVDLALTIVNAGVYALGGAALVRGRRLRTAGSSPDVTFGRLESSLKKRFPDLPEGFTLREGLARVRALGLEFSWDRIDDSLRGYEAYRYGSGPAPRTDPELVRLIRKLGGRW